MSLNARDVDVSVGGTRLVREVSIECASGEIVGVVGPNGSGKTMMISALAGRREASGEIRYAGRRLEQWASRPLARRRSVLRQHTHVPFDLSVREVVELGEMPWRGDDRDRTFHEGDIYLEAVGLEGMGSRSYPTLSGGEQRRTQLARILSQVRALEDLDRERWLLLDEPLASLDIGESTRIQRLMQRIVAHEVGILGVFHDLNAAAAVADTIVLLKEGESLTQGDPEHAMTSSHLERCFETDISVIETSEGERFIRSTLEHTSTRGVQS